MDRPLTRPAQSLRDEISCFFVDQIRTQTDIHRSLQALTEILVANSAPAAPLPALGEAQFILLHRLALVRICLLRLHGEEHGAPPVALADVRALFTAYLARLEQSPLGQPYARLLRKLDDILDAAPFTGPLADADQHDPQYRDAVRDQLLALAKLELELMRCTPE